MPTLALAVVVAVLAAAPKPIPWTSVGHGPTFGMSGRPPMLIKSRAETLHLAHFLTPEHATKIARLDFRKKLVVIAYRTFPTCGYRVTVQKLTRSGPTLRVGGRITPPPEGAGVCQAVTTPYHVITVARRAFGRRLPTRVVLAWSVARARA